MKRRLYKISSDTDFIEVCNIIVCKTKRVLCHVKRVLYGMQKEPHTISENHLIQWMTKAYIQHLEWYKFHGGVQFYSMKNTKRPISGGKGPIRYSKRALHNIWEAPNTIDEKYPIQDLEWNKLYWGVQFLRMKNTKSILSCRKGPKRALHNIWKAPITINEKYPIQDLEWYKFHWGVQFHGWKILRALCHVERALYNTPHGPYTIYEKSPI